MQQKKISLRSSRNSSKQEDLVDFVGSNPVRDSSNEEYEK